MCCKDVFEETDFEVGFMKTMILAEYECWMTASMKNKIAEK